MVARHRKPRRDESELRPLSTARRGSALIAVLVCLMVASVAVLGMLRATMNEQRQLRDQHRHLQAERLAAAGLDRAVAQLRGSAEYSGEIWQIAAEQLGGRAAASVDIRVEPIKDRPQQRTVHVVADYPDDPLHRVRKSREATVTLP